MNKSFLYVRLLQALKKCQKMNYVSLSKLPDTIKKDSKPDSFDFTISTLLW